MATRVDIISDCDVCAKAEEGIKRTATTTRPVPPEYKAEGDQIDVCDFCAVVYDLAMPQYPRIRARVDALPAALAAAEPTQTTAPPRFVRTPKPAPQALPAAAQLSIVPVEPTQRPATKPPSVTKPKPAPKATQKQKKPRLSGTLKHTLIRCPYCEEELPYEARGRHATRVHECKTWEIAWTFPDGKLLPFVCDKHEQCSVTNYGFLRAAALAKHQTEGGEGLIAWPDDDAPQVGAKPAPASQPVRRRAPNLTGRWIEGVDQLGCPLSHDRVDAQTPYWVDYHARGDHARKAHPETRMEEIAWFTKEGDTFRIDDVCPVCGLGFPSKERLERHRRSMIATPNPKHQAAA